MEKIQEKPRGVLRPQFAHGQFQHERLTPPAALADLVEHFWYVRWDLRGLPPQQQATLPHPSVHLVVESGTARIYGVHTERFDRTLADQDFAFGIKFKPAGFYPFLKRPLASLANNSIPAHSVFAGADSMARESELGELARLGESMLLAALPAPDPEVARVNALVAAIASDVSLTSVERVQQATGIGKRSLQRLFQKYVGIGPKWVIKRYRMHEAIERIQAGAVVDWTALALELQYFDQAHFIRDFRALVGQTPLEYARSLLT